MAFEPLDGADSGTQVFAIPQWEKPGTLSESATLPSFLYLPAEHEAAGLGGEAAWVEEAPGVQFIFHGLHEPVVAPRVAPEGEVLLPSGRAAEEGEVALVGGSGIKELADQRGNLFEGHGRIEVADDDAVADLGVESDALVP